MSARADSRVRLKAKVRLKPDTTYAKEGGAPPAEAFRPHERRIIERLRTPLAVQRYLNRLPYNNEPPPAGATLRSFRGVVRHGCAHCLEAALFAAVVLEQHGYPPLVLSFESIDELDHVIFIYQRNGRWGSVARSRDPGLHGRKPVFATPRALAKSYLDTYVDLTGRVEAFAVVDLRRMANYDWRLAKGNIWKVERMLLDTPHQPLRMPDARYRSFLERYRAFKQKYPDRKPIKYEGRERWTEIPSDFTRPLPASIHGSAASRRARAAGANRDRNRGWAW